MKQKPTPNGESPVQNRNLQVKAVAHVKATHNKPASIGKTGYYNDSKSKMKTPSF